MWKTQDSRLSNLWITLQRSLFTDYPSVRIGAVSTGRALWKFTLKMTW